MFAIHSIRSKLSTISSLNKLKVLFLRFEWTTKKSEKTWLYSQHKKTVLQCCKTKCSSVIYDKYIVCLYLYCRFFLGTFTEILPLSRHFCRNTILKLLPKYYLSIYLDTLTEILSIYLDTCTKILSISLDTFTEILSRHFCRNTICLSI